MPTHESLADARSICTAFTTPLAQYKVCWDTVQTVEYERTDYFYDLHVPGAEHYYAQGIWHHNTGKTRTVMQLLDAICRKVPDVAILVLRKYQRTVAATTLQTYTRYVLPAAGGVSYYGGSTKEPPSFRYPKGGHIYTGGMDEPEKWKGGEFDIIYVNEGTEIAEDDLLALLPLLRHVTPDGKPVLKDQRIIVDCNPANAGHYLNQKAERGEMRRIRTRITDNPLMANADGTLTEYGEQYLAGLRLTGSKVKSWIDGEWMGVENACYPAFDRSVHVRPLEPGLAFKAYIIGEDYGSEHLCTVCVLGIDIYNRRWVMEVWAGADDVLEEEQQRQGIRTTMDLVVARLKAKWNAKRGRVDPNQAKLARDHGFNVAKGGNGGATGAPRLHRIDLVEPLFYMYPGGRVPTDEQRRNLTVPSGPFAEPDSPGFFIVEGCPGGDDLADEIEGYHFVYTDTPKGRSKDVYRVADDRIASVEYANEEWEEGSTVDVLPGNAPPSRRAVPAGSGV